MKNLEIRTMETIIGGREETDEMGCGGVILLGAVMMVANPIIGIFVMGIGAGICASESKK